VEPWSARAIRQAVARFLPDVVHVHNTFPLISPSIFHALAGTGVARVLTLHNYRLFCPAAIPMRAGQVCTDCLDRRSVLPALQHGCYRNSRLATVPLALNVALHRAAGTWAHQVDAFIALTEFQRQRVVDAGLPASRVFVKPNFYPGNPAVVPWGQRQPYVVFAGRLTAEKGVATLIRAWQLWGPRRPSCACWVAASCGANWRPWQQACRCVFWGRWMRRGAAADCPGPFAGAAFGVL
jgi:glycosyltransferase involved in cell wall biosynthesis